MRVHSRNLFAHACAVIGSLALLSAQASDDPAKVRYDNGLRQLIQGSYTEALKDLDEAATKFPTSPSAGDALVLKAEYNLEIKRDLALARKDLDRIKDYPNVEPVAYLLTGRIQLAENRSKEGINSANAAFLRAYTFSKGNPYIPEGLFRQADAFRLNGQIDEAIEGFQNLALSYPRSLWTARGLVQLATCLTYRNRVPEALSALQRLRRGFGDVPEAAREVDTALNLNTILYRLYVRRDATMPAFRLSSGRPLAPTVKWEDVRALAFVPGDTLAVVDKAGVAFIDRDGELLQPIRAQDIATIAMRRRHGSDVAFKTDDRPVFLMPGMIRTTPATADNIPLKVPEPPDKMKPVEGGSALVATWRHEWLVGDTNTKRVLIFSESGEYLRQFGAATNSMSPIRLAINALDQVAVLDEDRKSVVLFDRDGNVLQRIEGNAPNRKFDRPVDIAFDSVGHLYVLDRGHGEVTVFKPSLVQQAVVQAVFTSPQQEKDPAAFRKPVAFAVDAQGRLFVYDENAKRIQIFQ